MISDHAFVSAVHHGIVGAISLLLALIRKLLKSVNGWRAAK